MLLAAKLIGLLVLFMGVLILIQPRVVQRMIEFWKQGRRIYIGAAIRICFGIVFILAMPESSLPAVLFLAGLLMLVSGIWFLVLGLEKTRHLLDRWHGKALAVFRWAAAFVIAFGVIVLYAL